MGVSRTYTVVQIDEERLFEIYFRGFAGRVHAYALRRADPQVAQDVTAETFLVAWRRRGEMPAEPLPWLYGIARGVLANERRGADRRAALTARMAVERAPPAHDRADRPILEALARLRDGDREALLLNAWEGLSAREAATVLGCSVAAFSVRLHRARKRLARALSETAEDPRANEPEQGPANHSFPEVSA